MSMARVPRWKIRAGMINGHTEGGPEDPPEQFAKRASGRTAAGRAGRRLLGPELSVQVRHRSRGPRTRSSSSTDVQGLHRSEEHGVPARHDARLQGVADAVRLRVRKSEREEELRLRDFVLGVIGLLTRLLSTCSDSRGSFRHRSRRPRRALLRAQPQAASRTFIPRAAPAERAAALEELSAALQRRLPHSARPGHARRVLTEAEGSRHRRAASKDVPPECSKKSSN